MKVKTVLGLALIVSGAVLALFFWDLTIGWFQGGPFGLLLVALGVVDIFDGFRRARGKKPKSLMDDLREDFGAGKSRSNNDDDY